MALMVLGIVAPVSAQPAIHSTPFTTNLIAEGRDTAEDVGDLEVDFSGTSLNVTYVIDEFGTDWRLAETHLYVGDSAPSKSSPGKFSYKHEDLEGVLGDSYTVSLVDMDLDEDGIVYIAAHAELQQEVVIDDIPTTIYETAWAQGDYLIRLYANWAMYSVVEVSAP